MLIATTWVLFATVMIKQPSFVVDVSSSMGVVTYTTVMLQLVLSYILSTPVVTGHSAALAAACATALGSSTAFGWLSVNPEQQTWLVAYSVISLGASLALVHANFLAEGEDAKNLKKLETILEGLDSDGDGEVTRAEFEMYFAAEYPGVAVDPVWKSADKDGPKLCLMEPDACVARSS